MANTNCRPRPAVLSVVLVALFTAGCGGPKVNTQVSGTVMMGGKPLEGVIVTFYPVVEGTDGLPFARGTTDATGHYTLALANGKSGAVVGQTRVVVNWPPRERSDTPEVPPKRPIQPFIPVRYTVASETPLIFDVKSGGPQTIDLTLDPNLPAS